MFSGSLEKRKGVSAARVISLAGLVGGLSVIDWDRTEGEEGRGGSERGRQKEFCRKGSGWEVNSLPFFLSLIFFPFYLFYGTDISLILLSFIALFLSFSFVLFLSPTIFTFLLFLLPIPLNDHNVGSTDLKISLVYIISNFISLVSILKVGELNFCISLSWKTVKFLKIWSLIIFL